MSDWRAIEPQDMWAAREMAIEYAKHFIGTFYSWGGDDPSGFDCSGLIVEISKSVGIFPRRFDTSANGMADLMAEGEETYYKAGNLVFWGKSIKTHVEMCVNDFQSIGASGGGSRTQTREDAIRDNAFIKIRPIESRGVPTLIINPFKEK